uniref:Aryl hydrocarbon receptor interacting protein n=1 Tax=Serinus canaria TaxID=9135 RepID=A0A8C9NX93_SERCA
MRRIAEGRDPLEGQKHRCGMGNMFDYHSTGYEDLDELQRTPQPLIFIMELFRVEDPSAYKRDTWAMSKEEKLAAVPVLHSEGNRLVLRREFAEAAAKYQEAVICLRNLQAKVSSTNTSPSLPGSHLKVCPGCLGGDGHSPEQPWVALGQEKPWEEGWLKLESLVTPLVLNYCQCQLELGEYYEVLEHTTELLQKHNDNAKAYFKRAKAHAAVWNEREAREDFQRVAHLDPSMAAAVKKELKQLGERMRKKHVEDRKRYRGLFQSGQGLKGQESREVGDGAPQGEAGVRESPGQGEQSAETKVTEQPRAPQAEQGIPRAGGEGAAPGGEEARGEPVGEEVEGRDQTAVEKEENLGTCRAKPESLGPEEGEEKEEEREEEEEEVEEEKKEKEKEESKEVERGVEEEDGKLEEEKEEVDKEEKEDKVEGEEKMERRAEKEDEKLKEGEEVEKEEENKETEREEEAVVKGKDKDKECLPAKMEQPEAGQCGTTGETKAAGLLQGLEQGASRAEGGGPGSESQAQPKRAPHLGAPSEGLGPAEGAPGLEDKTSGEALEEVSCREQGLGSGQENAGEGKISSESFTPGEGEELGGGAEILPCPLAARAGGAAPLEQCSKEQGSDQP